MTLSKLKYLLRKYPEMTETVRDINKEIDDAREEAQAIREAGSLELDGQPRGKNAIGDPTYKKAEKIIRHYDKRIKQLLDEADSIMREQNKLTDILRGLTPEEHAIIKARYLDGVRWDYMPGMVHMSRRACFNLHDRAMFKMVQVLSPSE